MTDPNTPIMDSITPDTRLLNLESDNVEEIELTREQMTAFLDNLLGIEGELADALDTTLHHVESNTHPHAFLVIKIVP